jgi:hypothetical protein
MDTITTSRVYDVAAGRRYAIAVTSVAGASVGIRYRMGSAWYPFRLADGSTTVYTSVNDRAVEVLAPTAQIQIEVTAGTVNASLVPLL